MGAEKDMEWGKETERAGAEEQVIGRNAPSPPLIPLNSHVSG